MVTGDVGEEGVAQQVGPLSQGQTVERAGDVREHAQRSTGDHGLDGVEERGRDLRSDELLGEGHEPEIDALDGCWRGGLP
ncbi:hypothetical protein [Modestobacter italicus]|uniref:hypothetical protein n=1 Tax=Modestobacter italicus (strain DSM 44449 / CECT 9708 / BC 501) TaxID=2732864 RepID=UPI001FE5549A|nr:hypothetical protein [Modestobacter italicus]